MTDIVRDVSPESLARANEANLAEGLAACARAYGGAVYNEPDLLQCLTPTPLTDFNRVLNARLAPETLDARIEWTKDRGRAMGVPFSWVISPTTQPARLGDHLVDHGFVVRNEEPAMGVALADLPDTLPLPAGVTIERVSDRGGLEQWGQVMCASFGMPDSVTELFMTTILRDSFGGDAAVRYYLARLNGDSIATAGLSLGGGVAGILSVATIPAARQRGIGAAVTLAPLLDARNEGYHLGVLQDTEMGYPVYARLGFTERFRYRNYVWRPG